MKEENFEDYHSLKLIESLTSIIDKRSTDETTIAYLKHTLNFIPWTDGIFDAWKELLNILNSQLNEISNQPHVELKEFVETLENDAKKFEVLELIIQNYFKSNHFEDAMTSVNQQIELSYTLNDPSLNARSFQNKGVLYHVLGQLDMAEEWYLKSFELLDEINSYPLKDRIIYSLGNLYQHYIANFEKSEEFYSIGYDQALKSENMEKIGFYLDHIGMSLFSQKKYEEALESHDKAWNLLKDQERNINVFFHKVQVAQVLEKLSKFDRLGLELYEIIDLKLTNQDPYSNCWYLILLSQYIDAKPSNYSDISTEFQTKLQLSLDPIEILREAKELAYRTKHVPSMVNSNLYLAKYKLKDDTADAMALLSEAKQLAVQNNRLREIELIKAYVGSFGLDYHTL